MCDKSELKPAAQVAAEQQQTDTVETSEPAPGEAVLVEPGTDMSQMVPATSSQLSPATVESINSMSPMQQFAEAKKLGMTLDEMKGMLEVQKDWEANEARKAFHLALSKFKENPPRIYKDMKNAQYNDSDYVSLGAMVNGVNEAMGPFGLNARWDYPESGDEKTLTVTCILSHAMGHEEKVTIPGPLDMSGTKNPLQARKSTRTYLKLETFEAVTGTASLAGNKDDDGNAAFTQTEPVVIERISEEQALTIHAKITDNELRMDKFMNWMKNAFKSVGAQVIEDIPAEMYQRVIDKLDDTIKLMANKDAAAE